MDKQVTSSLFRNVATHQPTRRCFSQSARKQQKVTTLQVREQQDRNKQAGMMTELVRDFLDPGEFFRSIQDIGIEFFCGVPDSLLKDFCAYVTHNVSPENHVITANEGSAVGMAAGYHLATGKPALVYMQNSGLGNAVNPLLSLASPSVYSIPMLLLVGWRGEPGKRDEPQHYVQGQATPGLLASLGVPFQPLPDYQEGAEKALKTAQQHLKSARGPYCLLVRRQTFEPYRLPEISQHDFPLKREDAIQIIVDALSNRDVVVGTTGMSSRELFEYRVSKDMGHERDFLTVGSMGHASSIAAGIALQKKNRQVFCLDGDGASIMHLGSMANIGHLAPENFKHIIINNGSHDSVGGQLTYANNHDTFSFSAVAKGCGYKEAFTAITEAEVRDAVPMIREMKGPIMLEIKVLRGGRSDLGRPTRSPVENKADFMHFLQIN